MVAIICGLDTRRVCIRIQITWGLSLLTQNAFLQRKKKIVQMPQKPQFVFMEQFLRKVWITDTGG